MLKTIVLALVALNMGYANRIHIKDPIKGVLEEARLISPTGILKQKGNGDVYLDISNDYISALYPIYELRFSTLWERAKLSYPKDYTPNGIGAHILVMTGKELRERGVWYFIKECNQEYGFSLDKEGYFSYEGFDAKKLHVLIVESEGLLALRKKYGLKDFPNNRPFHICTIYQHLYEDEW